MSGGATDIRACAVKRADIRSRMSYKERLWKKRGKETRRTSGKSRKGTIEIMEGRSFQEKIVGRRNEGARGDFQDFPSVRSVCFLCSSIAGTGGNRSIYRAILMALSCVCNHVKRSRVKILSDR